VPDELDYWRLLESDPQVNAFATFCNLRDTSENQKLLIKQKEKKNKEQEDTTSVEDIRAKVFAMTLHKDLVADLRK